MKKHLFVTTLILVLVNSGFSQTADSTFSESTYLFVSQKIGTEYIKGSCFFIKYKNKLFLITAAHVNKPWNPVKRKMYYDIPDTFYIKLPNKKSKRNEWLSFNNRQAKLDTSKYSIYERPDLFIAELKISDDYEIKTVNKFLKNKESSLTDKQNTVIVFGYNNSTPQTYEEMLFENPISIIGKIKTKPQNSISTENELNFDKYSYIAVVDSGNILHLKGMSGSPVFIKTTKSKFKFGGLVFAGVKNEIFVVRPKFIHEELLRLIKQPSK